MFADKLRVNSLVTHEIRFVESILASSHSAGKKFEYVFVRGAHQR